MKSLLDLQTQVLRNVGHHCAVDTTRDEQTLITRAEDEGDGFLTITLPSLAKALEKGLDQSKWPTQDVAGKFLHHRGLPVFLQGFLRRIFDKDGSLLDEPDHQSIWAVRQFCLFSAKIERSCSPEREAAAFDQFVKTDAEMWSVHTRVDPNRLLAFVKRADSLFGDVLDKIEGLVASYDLIPKHGPGSVAERFSQKEKRSLDEWPVSLDTAFPHWRYTSNTPRWRDRIAVEHMQERPVRVISVPKTQSTPRIIAIEPSVMQYAQQGLKRALYEEIGRHPHLSRILGFADQERNRSMAMKASLDQQYATLDLSEASDRIPVWLVSAMFSRWPHIRDFVKLTRSQTADVEGHGVIHLAKFASMGSALTFPIEAMVFTILASLGMDERVLNRNLPRKLAGRLSVYGDDIIVPTTATASVIDWLEHFGAKVNRHKSFWTGKFRESCGAEFYDGTDVSIERIRSELPSSRTDAASLAATLDLRNRLFEAGLWDVVRWMDSWLDAMLHTPYMRGFTQSTPGFLYRASSLGFYSPSFRWNCDLHRVEFRAPTLKAVTTAYRIDDHEGLLEWFHSVLRRQDIVDAYERQERAASFHIKQRWHALY